MPFNPPQWRAPRRAAFSAWALFTAFLVAGGASGWAQEEGYRTFTDKEGKAIEARLLAISADRRNMTIQRSDGMQFTLPIVQLQLDDQQYLKEWLQARASEVAASEPGPDTGPALLGNGGAMTTDAAVTSLETVDLELLSLEVRLEEIDSERNSERREGYTYRTIRDQMAYEMSVNNRGRIATPPLKLDYCIVYRNGVILYERDNDDDSIYTAYGASYRPIGYLFGSVDLPAIAYNRTERFMSETFNLETVRGEGNAELGEDLPYGIHLRLVDPSSGNVVLEKSDLDPEAEDITWDKLKEAVAKLSSEAPERQKRGVIYFDQDRLRPLK